MRVGGFGIPTGGVGYLLVGAGLAFSCTNFLVSDASFGEFLAKLGTYTYWAGWLVLLAWLVNGYRQRVTLRHTARVALWALASVFLTFAVVHVVSALARLGWRDVSPAILGGLLAASGVCAAAGCYEWLRRKASVEEKGLRAYDDWADVGSFASAADADTDGG